MAVPRYVLLVLLGVLLESDLAAAVQRHLDVLVLVPSLAAAVQSDCYVLVLVPNPRATEEVANTQFACQQKRWLIRFVYWYG